MLDDTSASNAAWSPPLARWTSSACIVGSGSARPSGRVTEYGAASDGNVHRTVSEARRRYAPGRRDRPSDDPWRTAQVAATEEILGQFLGDETFPVEWASETEQAFFWVYDDLHIPHPVSPMFFDIGGWWLSCDHMFRRFGTPFAV